MAAATIIAALVGAGGAIGSSFLGQSDEPRRQRRIGPRDPLMNQLLVEALMGLGAPIDESLLSRASPLGQFSNRNIARRLSNFVNPLIESGASLDEIMSQLDAGRSFARREIGDGGDSIGGHFDDALRSRGLNKLDKLIARSGHGSLRNLIEAEIAFQNRVGERAALANENQGIVEQGRRTAQRRIGEIQSDFYAPTASEIEAERAEMEAILRAQIERDFGEQREQSLYEANAYGINPAGRLGRLDESQALANLGTGPDSLARTLQLVAGRQGVQATALGSLQNSLQPAIANASGLLGMQMNQNASAAQQALGIAQLQSQNNQLLAGGVLNATQQIAAAPFLYQEMQRRRRELDGQIDSAHGIAGPINDDENDQFGF
jgi:hypothetical protein